MSTFNGQISEILGISIDRFDNANLESSVYFLSHCHTDHMKGLSRDFFAHLVEFDKYLYCSPVSKLLLSGIFSGCPEDRIRELENAKPQMIKYRLLGNVSNCLTSLTVTTSPAGHCPGSVMFVFSKEERTVLYTGDFRIDPRDLPKLNPLNNKIGGKNIPKKFDAIYLDTTFLSLDYLCFPSRRESCDEICAAVKFWLDSHPRNLVIIECSANYGSEYLFIEVFNLLKEKIHVKDKVYFNYMRIADLARCVTNDALSSRIHACTRKIYDKSLKCRSDIEPVNILTVIPSVQRWRRKSLAKISEYESENKQRLYVCYSMHPSYQELATFIDYFKPQKIFPCVCPSESATEINKLLKELTSDRQKTTKEEVFTNFKFTVQSKKISQAPSTSKFFDTDDSDDDS